MMESLGEEAPDARAGTVLRKYERIIAQFPIPDASEELQAAGQQVAEQESKFVEELADAIGYQKSGAWRREFWKVLSVSKGLSKDTAELAKRVRGQFADVRANIVFKRFEPIIPETVPDSPEASAQLEQTLRVTLQKYEVELADAIGQSRDLRTFQRQLWSYAVRTKLSKDEAGQARVLKSRIESLRSEAASRARATPRGKQLGINVVASLAITRRPTYVYQTKDLISKPAILGRVECFSLPDQVWSNQRMFSARVVVDAPNAVLVLPPVVNRPEFALTTTGSLAATHVKLDYLQCESALIIPGTAEIGRCISQYIYIGTGRLHELVVKEAGLLYVNHLKPSKSGEYEGHPKIKAKGATVLCKKVEDVYDIKCDELGYVDFRSATQSVNPEKGLNGPVSCTQISSSEYEARHAAFVNRMSEVDNANLPIQYIVTRMSFRVQMQGPNGASVQQKPRLHH
jgi:hypothetical protein